MIRLKTKISLFNLFSKLIFTILFLAFLPYIVERINLRYIDGVLIENRERILDLISEVGIEPFITSDSADAFGSYNLLKEEYISLERLPGNEEINYIDVSSRLIEGEEIQYRVINYSFLVDDQPYLLEVGKSMTSIRATEKNTRRILIVFTALIILVTFYSDFQYSRVVLRPLDRIIAKLRLISDPLQFDMSPVKSNTYDFVSLDNALTETMQNINDLFLKEKEITVNISHELLTPVSVVRSKLENLLLAEKDPQVQEKIEESLRTLHRLQSLVNSLLLIARIESRQYAKEDSVQAKNLIKEVVDEILPIADDKGVTLRAEMNIDRELVNVNKSLLFSMFYNIINNAVKNTPSGGRVIVGSEMLENNTVITVADTGKGLDDDQMRNLFERFKMRNENSGNGTGIGLAISKTIADFHNVDIKVASENGKGTKFSFILPEIS